jgi:hypothetical protein
VFCVLLVDCVRRILREGRHFLKEMECGGGDCQSERVDGFIGGFVCVTVNLTIELIALSTVRFSG